MNEFTTLGDRLHFLRIRKKLSALETAKIIGVTSPNTVYGYEKNNREPELKTLIKYAQEFEVNISWLMTGKELDELTEMVIYKLSEEQHEYSGNVILPVVSGITADGYNPSDEIRRDSCNKLDVHPSWFYLAMPDDSLLTGTTKSIKKGDLLLINPEIKAFYPGDLVAVLSRSGRQWVRFIDNWDLITLLLQGGIKLNIEDIAGMYRVIRVRPAEFHV
jgi:transcriptional regulator with XRE-family HTH domain